MKKAFLPYLLLFVVFGGCRKQSSSSQATPENTGPTIDQLVDDMKGLHEKEPNNVPHDWAKGPRMGYGNNPVNYKGEKFRAFIPWGQVYVAKGTEPVANTRVQLKNIKAFFLSKTDNQWKALQSTELVGGAYYTEDFGGNANIPATTRRETEGLSVKIIKGYNYHFWSENGRTSINPDDIAGIATTIQARLVVDDKNQPDDRNTSTYILSMGGDYWLALNSQWDSTWTTVGDAAIGKFRLVANEWKSFSMHTLTEDELRKNPPPFVKR
jgi:hypothetical protein